jgi:DNA-3-methyladenine glycosylase II
MSDEQIQRALRHLRRADPIMREVIRRVGPFRMRRHRNRFRALVFSILGQQISGSAAAAIRGRLADYLKPDQISPHTIARLKPDELRRIGLSTAKTAYVLDLAERVSRGDLSLDLMNRLTDEEVIETLIKVKGIGIWTAQMFLIFSLGRVDVFPHEDLGIRMAIRNLYSLDELPNKEVSFRIAAPWRPYSSIASWYCWRSLEFKKKAGQQPSRMVADPLRQDRGTVKSVRNSPT